MLCQGRSPTWYVHRHSPLTKGITQRDTNYYDHLQKPEMLSQIRSTVKEIWEDEIKGDYEGGRDCKWFELNH